MGDNARNFIKRCPNCARIVAPGSLMRVGAELDLRAALNNSELLAIDVADPTDNRDTAVAAAETPYADAGKLMALVQLAGSEPIECIKDVIVEPYVIGLLHGDVEKPWPANRPRKIMVFAIVTETYIGLRAELKKRNVRHCTLQGSRAQRDEAIRQLREEDSMRIMLVASPKDCAGLHLPFLSSVVFYHKILDQNVQSQVAARGQRTGREFSLEIITLLNETEAGNAVR